MRIIIRAKGLEVGSQFQSFVEEKIGSLKKYVDVLKKEEEKNTLAEVYINIEKETKHHKKGNVFRAEAKILLPGKKIIAKAAGDDLLLAVVKLKDKLQQEIKKYKLKNIESRRREQRKSQEKML